MRGALGAAFPQETWPCLPSATGPAPCARRAVCACRGYLGLICICSGLACHSHGPACAGVGVSPESQVAACSRMIERERVECLLVLPTGLYFWQPLLARLGRAVRQTVPLPFRPMFTGWAAKHRVLGANRSAGSRWWFTRRVLWDCEIPG